MNYENNEDPNVKLFKCGVAQRVKIGNQEWLVLLYIRA